MPIYEYECPKHGRYEVQQRISEDALKSCTIEACGEPVRKLISNTSFALKGGGWYSDLYSSSTKKEASSSSTTSTTTTSSTEKASAGGCGAGACGTGGGCASA